MRKHIIYTDDTWDDFKDKSYYTDEVELNDLDQDEVPFGSDAWRDYVYERRQDQYYDEKANLNKRTKGRIIGIGSIGRWDGTHKGFMDVGNNVNDVLNYHVDGMSSLEVFVEGEDIKAIEGHHDGTNYYTFRELNPKYEEYQLENFLEKLWNGKATDADIDKYTLPMGHYPAEVYGWTLEKPKKISNSKSALKQTKMPKQAKLNKMSKGV